MERHLRVLQKSRSKLLGLANVIGVGVGYKQVGSEITDSPALIIFVEKKVPSFQLLREQVVPPEINGVKTDVIEIGRVRFFNERIRRERPAQPGMSIGHYKISAGTFGAVVKDKTTSEELILSNNHILANASDGVDGRSAIGDPILQPGPHDGGTIRDRIGTLLRFVPLKRTVQEVECPVATSAVKVSNKLLHMIRPHYDFRMIKRYQGANFIDAAVARPDAKNLISAEILEVGPVKGVSEVVPGNKVLKSGRTTALTEGKVTAIGVTVKVEILENEEAWFTDQIVSDIFSRPGDSGSLIMSSDRQAVGLLFAGSDSYTVFNRIQNVLELLELTF